MVGVVLFVLAYGAICFLIGWAIARAPEEPHP